MATVFPTLIRKPRISIDVEYKGNSLKSEMESGLVISRARSQTLKRRWSISYSNAPISDWLFLDSFIRGGNMLENPNFEESSILPPFAWSNAANGTASFESSTQYAGARSLKVTASATNGSVIGKRTWSVNVGDSFSISGRVKAASSATSRIQLQFLNSGGSLISSIQPSTTSSAWILLSGSGAVPSGAVTAQFACIVTQSGGGVAYFDDLFAGFTSPVQDAGAFLWTDPRTNETVLVRFSDLPKFSDAGWAAVKNGTPGLTVDFTFTLEEV